MSSATASLAQQAQRESMRQHYLASMGIQTWFPRRQLKNAAPPRAFDWLNAELPPLPSAADYAVNDGAASEPHHAHFEAITPAQALSDYILPDISATKEALVNEATAEAAATIDADAATQISQFKLIVQSLSPQVLLIAEMPYSGLNQYSQYHQRLFSRLALALNIATAQAEPWREFAWPMAEPVGLWRSLNQNDAAATDAVAAYLQYQFALNERQCLLILGRSAARFVLGDKRPFDQLRGVHQLENSKQVYAISHSINEMMRQPVLKKEAWFDLADLVNHTSTVPTTN